MWVPFLGQEYRLEKEMATPPAPPPYTSAYKLMKSEWALRIIPGFVSLGFIPVSPDFDVVQLMKFPLGGTVWRMCGTTVCTFFSETSGESIIISELNV